jgi:hypothetical protein
MQWGGVRAGAAAGRSPSEPSAGVPRSVCLTLYCAQTAGPGPASRIASRARLRRPRGYRAGAVSQPASRSPFGPHPAYDLRRWAVSGPRATQVGPAAGSARGRRACGSRPSGYGGRTRKEKASQPASGLVLAAGGGTNGHKLSPSRRTRTRPAWAGWRRDGGPEPYGPGDSESAARRAVSSQGEGARR